MFNLVSEVWTAAVCEEQMDDIETGSLCVLRLCLLGGQKAKQEKKIASLSEAALRWFS